MDSDERVAIFTPATGELRHPKSSKTANLPSWRSADELCYIHSKKESSTPKKPEVVLYSLSDNADPRIISAKWPTDLLRSLDP